MARTGSGRCRGASCAYVWVHVGACWCVRVRAGACGCMLDVHICYARVGREWGVRARAVACDGVRAREVAGPDGVRGMC